MFFDVQSYVLVVLYKQLPVVVALYTVDDSCMAIEKFGAIKVKRGERVPYFYYTVKVVVPC